MEEPRERVPGHTYFVNRAVNHRAEIVHQARDGNLDPEGTGDGTGQFDPLAILQNVQVFRKSRSGDRAEANHIDSVGKIAPPLDFFLLT